MLSWLARWFIARVCVPRHEYRKGHLHHADGSLYMGRWGLFETRWLSARVHHIASADDDRALHDHPWNFVSLVLSGGYLELRPAEIEPRWCQLDGMVWELVNGFERRAGSVAFRRATDRHRVVQVDPGTYTLFIYGPTVQWWGFYTRSGKIHWEDFVQGRESAIRAVPAEKAPR